MLSLTRQNGAKSTLVVALGVYPHEEPGIGPNIYNFDDNVLYEIHVATGRDLAAGRAYHQLSVPSSRPPSRTRTPFWIRIWPLSIQGIFDFDIDNIGDANQNLFRSIPSPRSTWHSKTVLGTGSFHQTIRVGPRPFTTKATTAINRRRMAFRRLLNSTGIPNKPSPNSRIKGRLRCLRRPAGRWLLCRYHSIFDLLNYGVRARERIHKGVSTFT